MPPAGSFFDDDFEGQLQPGTLGAKVATGPPAPAQPVLTFGASGQGDDPTRALPKPPASPAPTPQGAPRLAPQPAAAPPPPARNLYGYKTYVDRTRGEVADEFNNSDIGREGNPRNLGTEAALAKYGSMEGVMTAISNFDHAYNKAINGSEGDYHGGNIIYKDEWDALDRANGGAGAGGAAGGPGGGAGGAGGAEAGPDFEQQIERLLSGVMGGQNTRYNPDTVRSMKAQAVEDASGAVESQNKALQRAAGRKGLSYSGTTDAEAAENRRQGGRDQQRALRQIDVSKAQADFEDQMAGADKALALVEQRRNERLANAKNATDVRRIESETAVARERIAADKAMAKDKLNQDAALSQQGYDAERASGAANRAWQDTNAQRDHDWQVEEARRREALELARLGLGGG